MAKRYFNVDGIGQVEVENMDEFRRWMNDNGVASGNVREFRKYEDDSSVYEVELWAEKDFTKANPNLRPFGEKNNYANADKAKIEANLRKKGLIPGGRHSDAEPPKAQAAEPYMGGMVQPQVNKKTGKIEYKPYNRDLTKEWVAEESTPEKQEYRQKVQEIGAEQDFLESSGAKKYIDERERLIDELEKMEFGAPPPDQPDAWTMWADRQRNMVERVEYLSKTAIPYRLTGMTEDERRQAAMFEDIGRNMPLLGATLLSLGHGAMGLVYKGANLIIGTPLGIGLEAIGVDTQGAFSPDNYIIKTLNARQAGLQAGLRDSGTFWNDLGTGFHSLPMSAAIMGEIALTGQAGLSTALTQGMITSDKYTEYMDDGRISQQEAWAGALSGAVQTVIEVAFDASNVKALKSAFAAGGRPALAAASRKMINETLWPSVKTYLKTQGSVTFHEISEEIAQETSDILIDHTLLGTPIPSSEELAERYRAAAFGAFYGSLLLGGLGGAITLQQSRVQQAQLKNLAENNWDSAKYLIEAHNQFNAGDIAAAEKSLNKALESAIEEGNADNRTIARGLANIKDAINTSKTHTALANNIEVGNLVREVGQLQEEAEKIGTAKTEQQYDRLSEIQTAIEQRQAKIAELEQVVNQDKETSEIYNLLKQASEAEQKARKAGDKAVKKLLKTKEYNEATPEQQRQMMKDAVLSDKKSAKLQEKADQKYREANLYKLRQTPAYKQAAPEVQTQMEEAELQRQQEAIAAEFEAARQKAISEQQEAEKAAETASNEATEEIEVIPDIIDQLEAKKAAIRQERQDINKELTEYRKLMDQQGGWLPSVTPEQKKAYHEVKQRQKEVNRKLNEVGIEIRKEKAAQKKAAAEQQKPKKKAKPKEKKKTEKPQETEAKEQPKKSKKAEAKETKKKEKPEPKKEAPQKEKEPEQKEKPKETKPDKKTETEPPAIEPYTPSARMRGGDKLRTEKFNRLYRLEKLRDAGVKKVKLGSATVGIETAIKRTENSLDATSQSEYWEWKKKRDTLIDADKIAVIDDWKFTEGKVIPDEVLKDYPELQTPETDTRTKSEALQETLPTIPDKTADDALLGMVKSHILSITRKDRTTTVNFKDGRQLVINHITQEAMMTEAGKTGVMYAGRTQGEKGKNVYTAIVDLVDGLNQGNRTLFHEAFHVVWKLFLNSEQISYIKQYYRAKANKGELVRKYVVTRQGTEMALYWTKEQFNALNRERQAEALEEGAAYGFEHWLGSRTDTAPTTMIGKLWKRLADAIRHALVKLNLANQNAKLTDIFHAVASDKLTGQGEQGAEATEQARYKQLEEKNLVTIHNIPVDSIEKVNSRGGLVMPSIAIIDATKTKFTGFGDASLIGDEKMIQPSAKQPLYTSDAYTPTYPKVYEIVKMDKNLEALAEYLSKKTKKKVTTWDLEANIEDQGSERYVASLLYGVMDYKKAQKEAIRTLEQYPINIEEKLFAGYTASGKRRYIPHTAENALRIMRKDSKDPPNTFWGTSSLRGALAAKFSSLAQAKKNRDMILSEAEMKPIEAATEEMFLDIAERANAVRKNQRAFYHSDIASDIYDMARYGWGRIADWYKDDSIKEDFRSFISHLRSLPTQYFEYKPQRVMGINEFVAAVIPTGTKASTAKALRDAGIKVYKYEAGDSESRFEVTKKASEELGIRYKPVPTAAEVAEAERQYAEVEAKYRGTAQWLKAPNGKPTNLNERQWVQVRTPNFKKWFGDWENDPKNASKVVDENGEPRVVYHGSSNSFSEFSKKMMGSTGTAAAKKGFWFAANPEVASFFAQYEDKNIYPVFLNIKALAKTNDAKLSRYELMSGVGHNKRRDVLQKAIREGKNGAMFLNTVDYGGDRTDTFVAFAPAQIKSATANVGTFSENPDIRYRKLTERERAMRDDVWNEIMGRPQKLRAETKPRVQTEPPERGQERKTEPPRPQPTRPSQSNPPTEAEIDVLSERIGKDLGIAPAQVKEKLGRQMMAAWREAQGDVSRLMESAAIRNFDEWVENNKPEGTDKKDLVWHWEEMLEYAAKVGLSREQIAQMVKSDRFDATAIGINLFQRMNYVGKLLVETEATLSDRNWGTPAEREQKEAQYGILQAQFDELQAAYAMQGSEAGTVLWTRRQNKAQYLENLTRAAQALESKINRGAVELGEMRQELDGLERTISDLEKSFEMLLRVMDGKRYKDITEMSNAELEAERQKQAERLNDLRNRAEHLRYEIDQKVAAMQADKGRQEETQTQIRKIRKTGRKAKVIEIKERKPDVHDWIRAAWYNSVLAGVPTHMVNMSANVVNSLLEDVITLFAQGGKVAGAQFAEKVRALFSNYEQLDPKTGEKIKTGAFAKAKEEFTSPQEFSKKNEVILKGNKLFMGIQFSTKFLGAEDMLAFFPNERGMLKSLAFDESKRTGRSVADLMENPTSDMLRQAYYEAKRNTFNQNPEGYVGVLIEAINKFYNALDQSGGGGKAIGNLIRFNVMPFTRVLGNVLNATIDYTPLGMIRYFAYKSDNPNSLLNRQRKDQNGRPLWLDENGDRMVSPFKARDARRQAARVALGTILGSLLYFLTMSADDDDEDKWFISGAGPQDYKKYKQLMAAGWRPFSFHIGNVIISYKEWPVSGAFAVIGNLHDIQKYDGKTRPQDWLDKTIYATMGVASSFLDRSFASNAISTATALDRGDPKWVKRSLTSTTSSTIIPYNNMLRFIENTYNRDLYTPETIAQQAWASVPLVPKKGLPRRVNVFGMYEKKDPATARLAMTDNVGLVVPDTKKTREIFQTVRKNNLFLSETTKREHRVDPYVGKRGIPEEDKQYIWLQGKDHENFRVMRGTEYVRLLNEPQNYNLIMQYDKNKDKDELAALLTSLGRKATAYATEETLKAYQRGELKHKYNTYNKSREEED